MSKQVIYALLVSHIRSTTKSTTPIEIVSRMEEITRSTSDNDHHSINTQLRTNTVPHTLNTANGEYPSQGRRGPGGCRVPAPEVS